MQSKYSLDSLNFAAFMKPNKHKTNSKDFSTTWPTLFSNTFTTVGEFKRLLQSFFSNRFSRHDGAVLAVPVTSTSARSSSPLSPTRAFWRDKSSQNHHHYKVVSLYLKMAGSFENLDNILHDWAKDKYKKSTVEALKRYEKHSLAEKR